MLPLNAIQTWNHVFSWRLDHWSSFIVEDDFKFIARNGLNAVRIPVGWWIASDPTPPWPYVGGSLQVTPPWQLEFQLETQVWCPIFLGIQKTLVYIELLNEPLSPGVTLETINKYYKAGYYAVRKHSTTTYVVMSNRLRPSEPKELFPLANGLMRSVIDVHYYNIFDDSFENMSAQQNIDFIYNNRSSELNFITTSNGPLTFFGKS
ncbi:putative glucan 1,3-beta-glucosidase [Medicago truncatula]|uniref:Putative glucan 1,3-beta-glucosidase n=1 Tax=Medicago truncatula TaxID=3880 RepID=A0A396HRT5_MEDTR|nr:putative glucan 1,3-beta-glucosidase [Medicago truncatula]